MIDKEMAERFISEYKKFLLAIYQPTPGSPEPQRVIDKLAAARKRFITNRRLLDEYLRDLEDGTEPIDRQMILAMRSLEFSRWVYLRDLKSCSIFLKEGGEYGYGVLGLNDEIGSLKEKYISDLTVNDEGAYWETRDRRILAEKRVALGHCLRHAERVIGAIEPSGDEFRDPKTLADRIEQALLKAGNPLADDESAGKRNQQEGRRLPKQNGA